MNNEERFSLERFKQNAQEYLNTKQLQEKMNSLQLRLDLLRLPTSKPAPQKPLPLSAAKKAEILKAIQELKKLIYGG